MSRVTDVVAKRLDTHDHCSLHDALRKIPGAFYSVYDDQKREVGFIHSCPCGCGQLSGVYFAPSTSKVLWNRSGTPDKPTLTPSVGIHPSRERTSMADAKYHWHGYLTDGVWRSV